MTNATRLLQLPAEVQELIAERRLSAGHGRALAGVADSAQQVSLAHQIVGEGWSVRQLEDHLRSSEAPSEIAVDGGSGKQAGEAEARQVDTVASESALLELENLLAEYLSTSVRVEIGERKGRLTVEFADLDDLERIYHLVTR